MQGEKDKPDEIRKAGSKKTQSDTRVALKGIYEYKGNKLLVTLKSFSIESLQTNRIVQTLPILYLKLIVAHVNSYKLVKTIESFLKQEGNSMSILEIEKI
jgi:sugar diacid utilization regulator